MSPQTPAFPTEDVTGLQGVSSMADQRPLDLANQLAAQFSFSPVGPWT